MFAALVTLAIVGAALFVVQGGERYVAGTMGGRRLVRFRHNRSDDRTVLSSGTDDTCWRCSEGGGDTSARAVNPLSTAASSLPFFSDPGGLYVDRGTLSTWL